MDSQSGSDRGILEYDLITALYESRNSGMAAPWGRMITNDTLRLIFAHGRFDIIEWLRPDIFQLPESITKMTNIILLASVEHVEVGVKAIAKLIHNTDKLHSILRCLMARLIDMDTVEYLAIASLLNQPDFWGFDAVTVRRSVNYIKKHFARTQPHVCQYVLVGHQDPTRETFIEAVLLGRHITSLLSNVELRIHAIEMLLVGEGISGEYAKEAFMRSWKQIRDYLPPDQKKSSQVGHLFVVLLENAHPSLYKWFLDRIGSLLSLDTISLVYEMALVDYIIITESWARSRQTCILTQIHGFVSKNADLRDVRQYSEWLIATGRLTQLKSRIIASLVRRLVVDSADLTDIVIARNLLFAYQFSDTTSGDLIREILTFCDKLYYSHSTGIVEQLPTVVITLLDLLGEVGLFNTEAARLQLLKTMADAESIRLIHRHVWTVSMSRTSTCATRRVIELFTLSPSATERNAKKIFDVIEGLGDHQQYIMVILSRLVGFTEAVATADLTGVSYNVSTSNQIRKIVLSDQLMNATVMAELTQILCRYCPHQLLVEFGAKVRDCGISLLWDLFVASANSALQVIVDHIHSTVRAQSCIDYERCQVIIRLLGHSANLQTRELLTILTRGEISHSLALTILSELETREPNELGDQCLAIFTDCTTSSSYHVLMMRYQSLIGPMTLLRLLSCPNFNWRGLMGEALSERLSKAVNGNLVNYLYAIVREFAVNGNVTSILLTLKTSVSEFIGFADGKLILGEHSFTRAQIVVYPTLQGGKRPDIVLVEHCQPKRINCATCAERLVGNIFIDSRDDFGIYYCSQCAESVTDAGFGSQITRASCAICLADDNLELNVLPCKHAFCGGCLAQLASHGSTRCPTCRREEEVIKINFVQASDRFFEEVKSRG